MPNRLSGCLCWKRRDDPDFWQSVTGEPEEGETPYQAALREVQEEVGIDITKENLELVDCHRSIIFEIFAHFRHRYAPNGILSGTLVYVSTSL